MTSAIFDRNQMWRDLEAALANKEFHLLFQPVLDLEQEVPWGAEALLRWSHPAWDDLSPRVFIPAAEALGMTFSLGEKVLDLLCRQGADWILEGLPALSLTTNITRGQLHSLRTHQSVARILRRPGFPADQLFLQITAKDLLASPEHLPDILDRLFESGAHVVVDDFGSRYSQLSLLDHPAISMIKLAPGLLDTHDETRHNAGILRAMSGYARERNIALVAKGVETEAHLAAAIRWGISHVQGFGISRPLAPDMFSKWYHGIVDGHREACNG